MEKKESKRDGWMPVKRWLDHTMITVYARPGMNWSITINKIIGEKAREYGLKYVRLETLSGFGLGNLALVLSNEPGVASLRYYEKCTDVYSKAIVTRILSHFCLKDGSYYMRIMRLPDPTKQKIVLMIKNVIDPLTMSEPQEPGKSLVKMDSIEKKPVLNPLTMVSDDALFEELKKRGYNGTIRKEYSL